MLKDTSALVTGASGFIGRHLVNALLNEKADVSIISSGRNRAKIEGVKTYAGSLEDYEFVKNSVEKIRPSKVFHLGAFTEPSRDLHLIDNAMRANFYWTVNLLNALKNIGCESFVFCSTAEVYGNNKTPFKEGMELSPVSPYSLSKAAAEMYCNLANKSYECPATILRLFLIYGPGQGGSKFIPQLISTLLQDREFIMTPGNQKRDFVFVADAVDALLRSSSKKSAGETINICSGRQHSLRELADMVENIIGKKKSYKIWNPLQG